MLYLCSIIFPPTNSSVLLFVVHEFFILFKEYKPLHTKFSIIIQGWFRFQEYEAWLYNGWSDLFHMQVSPLSIRELCITQKKIPLCFSSPVLSHAHCDSAYLLRYRGQCCANVHADALKRTAQVHLNYLVKASARCIFIIPAL